MPSTLTGVKGIERTLERLWADHADGTLADLCGTLGIDLLTLFGSAVTEPGRAGDVDLAYARSRERGPADHVDIVNAFGSRYGDTLDIMDLEAAGSVARFAGLHGVEVLVELTPGRYANAQMAAFKSFCDTQRLRDRVLDVLAG